MGLFFNIDCDSGLEVDGEVILKDRNLRDQALDQRLVKLRDGGGLLMDEILQVLDQAHLLILDHAVDLGLFSHTESLYNENLDLIVITGGSFEWHTPSEYLDGAEDISVEYDQVSLHYGTLFLTLKRPRQRKKLTAT